MKLDRTFLVRAAGASLLALAACSSPGTTADPLPSWNAGATRATLLDFVERVTDPDSPDFVPAPERVAVFDNDGTLWTESPLYFQAYFAVDRIRAMAPDHPEWKDQEPYESALAGDLPGLLAQGQEALVPLLLTAHSGQTGEAFRASVRDWLGRWRHPDTGRAATEMVYQPMLELLDHLRASGFRVHIVTGGGIDFVRAFAEETYGVPPEQVVGTTGDATFELRDGVPVILKEPKLLLLDDGPGKPVGIYRHIGRRPILAGGNSDGDLQMLQYTTLSRGAGDTGARLGLIVHHTDAEREYAYDRDSHVGRLDRALDAAPANGWLVVDMRRDWATVHPPAGD